MADQVEEKDSSITQEEMEDGIRSALLTIVDLIERRRGISPRTAEIRQWWRKDRSNGNA